MKHLKNLLLALIIAFCCFQIFTDVSQAFDLPFAPVEGQVMPEPEELTGVDDEGAKVITGGIMLVITTFRQILGIIVTLWIVYYGFKMVTAGGDEEAVNTAKRGITWAIISLGLILISGPLIKNTLYGGGTLEAGTILQDPTKTWNALTAGNKQIMAFLEWFRAIVVTLTMLFIMYSGWSMIEAVGDQEKITKQKTSIFWIAIGILVIAISDAVINVIYDLVGIEKDWTVTIVQHEQSGIAEFMGIVKYLLTFTALIAFIAIIAGGAMFILNFGNDERVETGKKIAISALIGLVIIGISYVIVSSVVSGKFT